MGKPYWKRIICIKDKRAPLWWFLFRRITTGLLEIVTGLTTILTLGFIHLWLDGDFTFWATKVEILNFEMTKERTGESRSWTELI